MTRGEPSGHRRRAVVEVALATVLFSFVGPVAKLVQLSAEAISFWRAVFSALVLALVVGLRRDLRLSTTRRQHAALVGMGALMAGNWYFYVRAVQVSTVAIAVVCLFTYPLISALLEPLIFREAHRWWMMICSLLVLLGVTLLAGDLDWQSGDTRGAVYGISAAVCFALRNLWSRKAVQDLAPSHVTLYQFVVAGVAFSYAGIAARPTLADLGLLVVIGAVLTTVSQSLFIASLRYLSTSFASILVSVQPVYATLIAWALLGEVPEPRTLSGGVLVVGAVFIALFASYREEAAAAR